MFPPVGVECAKDFEERWNRFVNDYIAAWMEEYEEEVVGHWQMHDEDDD